MKPLSDESRLTLRTVGDLDALSALSADWFDGRPLRSPRVSPTCC